MNFIAACLLLYMPEEVAFWVLCAICEDIVPEYYRPAMVFLCSAFLFPISCQIGTLVDQQVLGKLLEERLPVVAAHIKKLDLELACISLPWFVCLFLDAVPLEVTRLPVELAWVLRRPCVYLIAFSWMARTYFCRYTSNCSWSSKSF